MKIKKSVTLTAVAAIAASLISVFGASAFDDTRIELNSGAERDAEFVSVNQGFACSSGNYQLTMYGLKEQNESAVLQALAEHYDPESQTPLTLVDNAFPDAEKYDAVTGMIDYDSGHCWAASASNMLWISGWANGLTNPENGKEFTSEDDVFCYFNRKFTDSGADVSGGIDWFFMGEFFNVRYGSGTAIIFDEKNESDGLMKELCSTVIQKKYDLTKNPEDIAQLFRCDWTSESPAVFEASIGEMYDGRIGSSSHAVNVAGVITDPSADSLGEKFKAILIIDSDNDGTPETEDELTIEEMEAAKSVRPNTFTVYDLQLINDADGKPCWELSYPSYDEPMIIYSINALPLYDEEIVTQNTETEGTKSVVKNVDLTLGEVIATDISERAYDTHFTKLQEREKTEFKFGEPIYIDYFVENRSYVDLDEEYADGKQLELKWTLTDASDNSLVKEGTEVCELPLTGNTETGFVLALNASDEQLAAGNYTLTLALNPDKTISEAYYLNNLPKSVSFTVTDAENDSTAPSVAPEETTQSVTEPETSQTVPAPDNTAAKSATNDSAVTPTSNSAVQTGESSTAVVALSALAAVAAVMYYMTRKKSA